MRRVNQFLFDDAPQPKKKFDNSVIQEMLKSVDILQILEDEYNLLFEPGTKGWWNTNCPMPNHRDSSPSFGVHPETGKFNCFGCGEKGDLLSFIRAIEGISFGEAVERLRLWSGFDIEEGDIETHRALRDIDISIEEYLGRSAETDLPGGMSPVQFLRTLAERLREYEKRVNFDKEEVSWVDGIYKQIDNFESKNEHLEMRKIWDGLQRQMKERLTVYNQRAVAE